MLLNIFLSLLQQNTLVNITFFIVPFILLLLQGYFISLVKSKFARIYILPFNSYGTPRLFIRDLGTLQIRALVSVLLLAIVYASFRGIAGINSAVRLSNYVVINQDIIDTRTRMANKFPIL